MAVQSGRWQRCVLITVVLGAASAASMAQSQGFAGKPRAETTAPLSLGRPVGLTGDDIIREMLEHNRLQNGQLQRYSAVRTYEIRNIDGKLAAQAVVRVDYEAPDKKRFRKTSEKGSGIVRHLVFDRLLQSEGETSSGREHHDSAITPANYTFTLAGEDEVGPYDCFVFAVTPKRKDKYLFEGKIWIAADDFAIVRVAGHPAKKPSFWINRADFVREYQRIDGFWVPLRDETYVEVRMYGRRVFTIDHEQYVINPRPPLQAVTGETSDADEPLR
ncbi:MAG TPA: hypothetical protein VF749_04890 [Candidatus Acidoferrum sp.]